MTNSLEDEVRRIVAGMDNELSNQEQETPGTTEQDIEPAETVHIHYFPDAIVILKEDGDAAQVVDSEPVIPQNISFLPAYAVCSFYLFLIFSCIAFQAYEILNPPIATVTIIPKSQIVTLIGTLQMGRLLNPITISQTQTVPATGKGHQDARNATGTVTFFNGLFTQQFVASGTVYTGNDGIEIVTTQDATIPPGSPGTGYGTATVTAQALQAGAKGNIAAGDIDIAINNGLLVRNSQFYNGQDQRDFSTVSKQDINKISTPLKISLAQSIQGALQSQLKPSEQLYILPCNHTVTSDHRAGDEAIQVKVTVSETCSAVAYNSQELETKARALLTSQAQSKLAGYSLFGNIQIKVNQASVSRTNTTTAFLLFQATGTWIYGLSGAAQERMKKLIAGKPKDQALQILAALPEVERGSISFTGFIDDARLPKNIQYIDIILLVS